MPHLFLPLGLIGVIPSPLLWQRPRLFIGCVRRVAIIPQVTAALLALLRPIQLHVLRQIQPLFGLLSNNKINLSVQAS